MRQTLGFVVITVGMMMVLFGLAWYSKSVELGVALLASGPLVILVGYNCFTIGALDERVSALEEGLRPPTAD